jgi:hypothetical protein
MAVIIRPHHLLDILRDYGYGIVYQPHAYGHALHLIAENVMADPDCDITFVVAAEDICRPCRYLRAEGTCDDMMTAGNDTISKQTYNDALDRRLWEYLDLDSGNSMTIRNIFPGSGNVWAGSRIFARIRVKKRRIGSVVCRKG